MRQIITLRWNNNKLIKWTHLEIKWQKNKQRRNGDCEKEEVTSGAQMWITASSNLQHLKKSYYVALL